MSEPVVTAIVVNWNAYEETANCISELKALEYDRLNIVLVDNGSCDNSVEHLASDFPEETLVQLDDNLGFPAGVNQGIECAPDSDFYWLVNNDVYIPDPESLEKLVNRMESSSNLAAITPKIMQYPNKNDVWFKRGYVDRRSGISGHVTHARWFFPYGKVLVNRNDQLLGSEYIPFTAVVIRASVFDEVGDLEESYFLYGSDIEFCLRARRAGYEVATDPAILVYHKVSGSTSSASPTVSYYPARNTWLLRQDSEVGGSGWFYLIIFWWLFLHLGDRLRYRNFSSAWALLRGFLDGCLGHRGRGPFP